MTWYTDRFRTLRPKIQSRAPRSDGLSPGPYRRFPGYGDEADSEDYAFYPSVICLVQSGLEVDEEPLIDFFYSVIDAQSDAGRSWPAVIVGFGRTVDLEAQPIVLRDWSSKRLGAQRFVEAVRDVCRAHRAAPRPQAIASLYPTTPPPVIRGKSRFDRNDLLIVIGRSGEIRFDPALSSTLARHRRRSIIVEHGEMGWRVGLDESFESFG